MDNDLLDICDSPGFGGEEGAEMNVKDILEVLLKCNDPNYRVFIGGEEVTSCEIVEWDQAAVKFNGRALTNRVELTTRTGEGDDGEIA
jgi:hypothetical protein